MKKVIHLTKYNSDTYFVLYKNKDRSLKSVLHCTWFEVSKSYPPKTKFQQIYNDLKIAIGKRGYDLKDKFEHNNFKAVLKRLDQHQLKLFSA